MNEAIAKLAKALGCSEADLEVSLDRTDLALVWDPEDFVPQDRLLAVYMTKVKSTKDSPVRPWWTLKPLDKGKHTNRSTGEVFKWK